MITTAYYGRRLCDNCGEKLAETEEMGLVRLLPHRCPKEIEPEKDLVL